jgi:hypothetical protein
LEAKVGQRRQHLAGLVAVVVNGLLAQDDQAGLLYVHQGFEQFGHGQGLQLGVAAVHQDRAVGTNGHRGAQGFLTLAHTARDSNHFRDHALLLQTHRFFHSDFVKRVHAHLHVGDVHPRAV